jgi:hypothetical protein
MVLLLLEIPTLLHVHPSTFFSATSSLPFSTCDSHTMELCLRPPGKNERLTMRFQIALGDLFAPGEIYNEALIKMVPLMERAADRLCEPTTSTQLMTRFRTSLGTLFASRELDNETLTKMVPLLETAANIRKSNTPIIRNRPEHAACHATCHAERSRIGKRKLPNCFQNESQSVDEGLGSHFGPSESHTDKPTLRQLIDTKQNHTFRWGGIADIPIESFANIRLRVEAAHRAVILHEILIQSLRSVGVEDGPWINTFEDAIQIASNLEILTPTEATFFNALRLE